MAILPEAQDDVVWVRITDPPRTHPPNTKSTFGNLVLEYTDSRTFMDVAFWCLITLKSPTSYFVGQILLRTHINLHIFTDVAFRCLITLKSPTSYFVDQFFCISIIILWICSSYPSPLNRRFSSIVYMRICKRREIHMFPNVCPKATPNFYRCEPAG